MNKDAFMNYVGIKTKILREGKAESILHLEDKHLRLGNFVNGGVICSLVDIAGGTAVLSTGKRNQVTTDLNINFLNPLSKSPARAVGEVIRKGRNICVAKVEVFDGDGKLCAYATGSWFIFQD
ncbi:MAG: PaaI family thioesterase [Thermoplasmata archaeon]